MKSIFLVGEDALCCALAVRLVQSFLPDWQVPYEPRNTRGKSRLQQDLRRYAQQAMHVQPVLCIADSDLDCPRALQASWLQAIAHQRLLLRFAVREADSWLMADREQFARSFGVPVSNVPRNPDALPDSKRTLLQLLSRHARRTVRQEVVAPHDPTKPGSGYNEHLCGFVMRSWRPRVAEQHSESLQRAARALQGLAAASQGSTQ